MSEESAPRIRPARLPDSAPLDYAPDNEQGVIYLFSRYARSRFGLRVERVKAGFPDCIAYRDGKRIRIEFEYRSRNFKAHGHPASKCDWIVCWIHDWPSAPEKLRIVELRKYFGLGFNVWFQPVAGKYAAGIGRIHSDAQWSVASQAAVGDLILFYRAAPEGCVRDVFQLVSPVRKVRAGWKTGQDYMGAIEHVATLEAPLHFSEMRQHKVLRDAGFVRGMMRGRYRASDYWPELYEMIISRNPAVTRKLRRFGPDRLT